MPQPCAKSNNSISANFFPSFSTYFLFLFYVHHCTLFNIKFASNRISIIEPTDDRSIKMTDMNPVVQFVEHASVLGIKVGVTGTRCISVICQGTKQTNQTDDETRPTTTTIFENGDGSIIIIIIIMYYYLRLVGLFASLFPHIICEGTALEKYELAFQVFFEDRERQK